ncbi:hypothetical protein QBC34DRAFT_385981 [Podospora aff. communis PSN243]|uniref:Uncharacterized protein n=1 Tax=Podospora aff. communis PSN243 TaxID=3040156 RepID=A0AAV9G6P0_9PEZI|nr:hypothetical protein QBC34DRAFT_385981 [Podospora aff. communis PSN243]
MDTATKVKISTTAILARNDIVPRQLDAFHSIDNNLVADMLKISRASQSREALTGIIGAAYGDLDPTNPITVQKQYTLGMFTALKLQFAFVKIFGLAGGEEALKDVGDWPDYLDEDLE